MAWLGLGAPGATVGGRCSVAEAAGNTDLEGLADLGGDTHTIAVRGRGGLADGALHRVVAVGTGKARLLTVGGSGICC